MLNSGIFSFSFGKIHEECGVERARDERQSISQCMGLDNVFLILRYNGFLLRVSQTFDLI